MIYGKDRYAIEQFDVRALYLAERHRAFPRDEEWDIPEIPIRAPYVRGRVLMTERTLGGQTRCFEGYV